MLVCVKRRRFLSIMTGFSCDQHPEAFPATARVLSTYRSSNLNSLLRECYLLLELEETLLSFYPFNSTGSDRLSAVWEGKPFMSIDVLGPSHPQSTVI